MRKKLGKYRFLRVKIRNLKRKIDRLEQEMCEINTTSVIKMEGKSTAPISNFYKLDKLIEVQNEFKNLLLEAELEALRIEKIINQIEEELPRNILFLYFICNASFEEIAVELNYHYQHIRKVFYRHLNTMEKSKN